MKRIALLTVLFCLFFSSAETFLVTQTGAGGNMSVFQFNDASNWGPGEGKISAGDTVYFKGEIEDTIYVRGSGSSTGFITLDGYAAGDSDALVDTIDMFRSDATLKKGLFIGDGHDYIIFQDMDITTEYHLEGKGTYAVHVQNYNFDDASDHIIMRRNFIHDVYGGWFTFGGVYNTNTKGHYLTIKDNHFKNYDLFSLYNPGVCGEAQTGAAEGSTLTHRENVHIQGNIWEHVPGSVSAGGQTIHNICGLSNLFSSHSSDNLLIEYNEFRGKADQANLVVPKDSGGHNIVVRFNKIFDSGGAWGAYSALYSADWAKASQLFYYGNNIYGNNGYGLQFIGKTWDVHVWSNIFNSNYKYGGLVVNKHIPPWPNDPTPENIAAYNAEDQRRRNLGYYNLRNFHLYNNVIANSANNGNHGSTIVGMKIFTEGRPAPSVKNNIIHNSGETGGMRKPVYLEDGIFNEQGTGSLFDYNTYWSDNGDLSFMVGDTSKNWYQWRINGRDANSNLHNPRFGDPDGNDGIFGNADDDYSLDGAHVDDGVALAGPVINNPFDIYDGKGNRVLSSSELSYEIALHPETDWTAFPSPDTIITARQGDNGNWERGAYVFDDGSGRTCVEFDEIVDAVEDWKGGVGSVGDVLGVVSEWMEC
jgi:hypothetical protein